ncbi:alpha-amylase/4-alpha-glucanotransferase domain-containing protein [Thermococcus sp.]|uniref:alpha-amylase/4-alpha-glucanotransferase domain-containing protein n=1 Tax=Thermococcus sp. TaxID=35749 RepID=UPI00261E63C1|nr:alpha-amylase/4-alpha-glucanotransferase domain-containing protein [Thermococcus sp.]
MKTVKFIFGIHNHQPLGNFGWVFESAYERAYRPFLETLEEYPNMKVAVHYSGPLLEWIAEHRPEHIELLRNLVRRGQLEIVVAGFYEPVLASIPEEDRIEQINLLKGFSKRLGYDSKGLWLTERVWEPELVGALKKAGIEYVIVDDYHFLSAGLPKESLYWPYYTENNGEGIAVFPIDERLRYLIPFRPVERTLEYLHSLDDGDESKVAVFHDDGEKFGIWPGTYEWVHEKGWLREFFDEVSSDEKIEVLLYSEYLERFRPRGLVYLPIASYFEMSEWSLPAEQAKLFVEFVDWLKARGVFERYRVFVRGGIWKNFFFKYPEGNYMHKRMLMVSKLVRNNPEARRFILRAQCNDAYWHGVFGGIYLPHLRRAVWENIIRANTFVSSGSFVKDIDFDGLGEVFIEGKNFYYAFKPGLGGSLVEFSSKSRLVNYADVLTRRHEHYHSVGSAVPEDAGEGVESIHELSQGIPEEVRNEIAYDSVRRALLQDRFLRQETTLDDFRLNRYDPLVDFSKEPYGYSLEDGRLRLWRSESGFSVVKTFKPTDDGFVVDYSVAGRGTFAVELNVAVHSVMESPGELYGSGVEVNDKYAVGRFSIELDGKARIWKFPVKTLSKSESGWDFIQQGVSYTILFPVEEELAFRLRFVEK